MMSLDLGEVSQCVLPGNNRNEIELHPRQPIQRHEPGDRSDDPDPPTNIHPDTWLHDVESWHQCLQIRRVLGGSYVGIFFRYGGWRICFGLPSHLMFDGRIWWVHR